MELLPLQRMTAQYVQNVEQLLRETPMASRDTLWRLVQAQTNILRRYMDDMIRRELVENIPEEVTIELFKIGQTLSEDYLLQRYSKRFRA